MALLHSRVGRVFYEVPNKLKGGIGSLYKIHTEEALNHNFEVYQIIRQPIPSVSDGNETLVT